MRLRPALAQPLVRGQVTAAALGFTALFLGLVFGLVEVGRLYLAAQRAAWAAEVGVMAGLSRRDIAGSQACACPRLLADAAAYAEAAVDAAAGGAVNRACDLPDSRTVRCRVTLTVASPVLAFLGFGPLGLTQTRTGVLEWQTKD